MNLLISKRFLFMLGILLLNMRLYAEVVTDGTVGPVTTLTGDFMISDKLGQQLGGNLFHSFKDFNVNTGERATFTGPGTVTNILARVTGSNRSFIDGVLRSDIPNANLYLLNPSGILFGENASLDITGSFHTSTADYLRLGENGRFSASYPKNSVLITAPPEAFGFLDNKPASISIQGSFIIGSKEKTLSMIGGELQIEDGILFASGGRINLAAVASAGEVVPTSSDLGVNTFEKLGKITLSQSSSKILEEKIGLANIDVTDHFPSKKVGQIFIRAGQFFSDKGHIFADTYGNNPSEIDIFIDGDMHLTNGAKITADNLGNGQGGYINVTTNALRLSGLNMEKNGIDSLSTIATNNKDEGIVGGEININTALLEMNPGLIQSATESKSDGNLAGNIFINAQIVRLQNGGFINAETTSSGQAGNIRITATDEISLLNSSSISGSAGEKSSGNAGNIHLDTRYLTLKNGGQIHNASFGSGNAGSINLIADTLFVSESSAIATIATRTGGGNIDLQVHDRLYLVDNSTIITEAQGMKDQHHAGNITIKNPKIFTLDNSNLITSANRGQGGNVDIEAVTIIPLGNSKIDVSSAFSLNGKLRVNGIELNENFTILKQEFLKADSLFLNNRCAEFSFSIENLNRFLVIARDTLPTAPSDLRTHLYVPQ